MRNDRIKDDKLGNARLIDAIGLVDDAMIRDAKIFGKETGRRNARLTGRAVMRRAAVLAAALALCVIVSVPVLAAAEVETAQELLYTISPSIAQRLKPIRKSCVNNGIQMEVVSAKINGSTAEVYIAMKDLEGDRIDGTMDLFDSYDIRQSGDCMATCNLEHYDEETKVATFLLLIQQTDGKNISGDKVTFTVSKFMSHKKVFQDVIADEALLNVSKKPETVKNVSIRGRSGAEEGSTAQETFLKPGATALSVPAEGAEMSAIGYLDGKLHVQMYYADILNTDNHGGLWLEDSDGNKVECIANTSFWDDEESGSYEEYVFDVPYEKLGNYKLFGEVTVCDALTEGDWQVTFPISDAR